MKIACCISLICYSGHDRANSDFPIGKNVYIRMFQRDLRVHVRAGAYQRTRLSDGGVFHAGARGLRPGAADAALGEC